MKRIRNRFRRPLKRWDAASIKEDRAIMKEFGLKRKKEIHIAKELLRNFRRRARELIAIKNKDQEKVLLDKLVKIGLLEKSRGLDDVLALTVKDVLARRLQTIVHRKGFAPTAKQARQMIVHGRIKVGNRRTDIPSYIVTTEEENSIVVPKPSGRNTAPVLKAQDQGHKGEPKAEEHGGKK